MKIETLWCETVWRSIDSKGYGDSQVDFFEKKKKKEGARRQRAESPLISRARRKLTSFARREREQTNKTPEYHQVALVQLDTHPFQRLLRPTPEDDLSRTFPRRGRRRISKAFRRSIVFLQRGRDCKLVAARRPDWCLSLGFPNSGLVRSRRCLRRGRVEHHLDLRHGA